MNLQDFLNELDNEGWAEEKTVYQHVSSRGVRTDFESIERTKLGAYPETHKIYRSRDPASCGHPITKQRGFAGFCNFKPLFRKLCNLSFCIECEVRCPRCNLTVCSKHARTFAGVLHCKRCARGQRRKQILGALWLVFSQPFMEEDYAGLDQTHDQDGDGIEARRIP